MTDAEHEYVKENSALQEEVARLEEIAARALRAAIQAQEAAHGRHDDWLDAALRSVQIDAQVTSSEPG